MDLTTTDLRTLLDITGARRGLEGAEAVFTLRAVMADTDGPQNAGWGKPARVRWGITPFPPVRAWRAAPRQRPRCAVRSPTCRSSAGFGPVNGAIQGRLGRRDHTSHSKIISQ